MWRVVAILLILSPLVSKAANMVVVVSGVMEATGIAPAVTPPLSYEQIVASNTRISTGITTATSSTVRLECRRYSMTGGQPINYFRLIWPGYIAATSEVDVGNSYGVEASIEIELGPEHQSR